MRVRSLLVLGLLASCGSKPPPSKCSQTTCTGCCDASGTCQSGNVATACGANGALCEACKSREVCAVGGVCLLSGVGGGSGAGGGLGTGGGGASGGAGGAGWGASGLKPDVMILLDRSGSMLQPIDKTAAGCPVGCNVTTGPCPANCPTRIGAMRLAMANFLGASGTVARYGLTLFPSDAVCGATLSVASQVSSSNDVASELQLKANEISSDVVSLTPGGGTPTGASLRFLTTYAPLQDAQRSDYVLLLTDGLPNCNAANPNTCTNAAACQCTLSACTAGAFCATGCLDQTDTVSAINELRAKQIRTIVLGFGGDAISGAAASTLNAMAEAGGSPRACPSGADLECGSSGPCEQSTRLCTRRYYLAADQSELELQLSAIAGGF